MNNYTKKITTLCAKTEHKANLSSCDVCNKGGFKVGIEYNC